MVLTKLSVPVYFYMISYISRLFDIRESLISKNLENNLPKSYLVLLQMTYDVELVANLPDANKPDGLLSNFFRDF